MYDHLSRGWLAVCLLALGLSVMSLTLAFCYTGERPLGRRLLDLLRKRARKTDPAVTDEPAVTET